MPISNPIDEPTLLGKYYETYVNRINDEIIWFQDNYPSENVVEADAAAFQSGVIGAVGGIDSTVTQAAIQNDPSTQYRLDLGGFVINAYVVYNLILNDAIRYNRIRLTRIKRNLSGDNGVVTVLYDNTQVAILSEAYILPFDISGLINQQEFAPGQLIQDEDYELLFQQLYDRYVGTIRNNQVTFESTICHSSCHSSCHGSRGRR
jgi:hypothetical protein